jgi:hypothetical protein
LCVTDAHLAMRRLVRLFKTLRDERRALGWGGLLRRRGWTFVALVIAYYLIRDILLYVLVPLAVAAGVRR